jgi:hypothetical protein
MWKWFCLSSEGCLGFSLRHRSVALAETGLFFIEIEGLRKTLAYVKHLS